MMLRNRVSEFFTFKQGSSGKNGRGDDQEGDVQRPNEACIHGRLFVIADNKLPVGVMLVDAYDDSCRVRDQPQWIGTEISCVDLIACGGRSVHRTPFPSRSIFALTEHTVTEGRDKVSDVFPWLPCPAPTEAFDNYRALPCRWSSLLC